MLFDRRFADEFREGIGIDPQVHRVLGVRGVHCGATVDTGPFERAMRALVSTG